MAYAYTPNNDMKTPYPAGYPMNPGMPTPNQPPYYNTPVPPPVPIIQPVRVVQPMGFGHMPQAAQCSACRQQIVTNVRYECGGGTWLFAFLICIFGGVLGCCFIPFCVSSCQDAVHTCPACQAPVGRKNVL
ncbi:unnamed protein product [Adineta ricciae]|uniref:LITAF domain-containing protein n=1 Tax=Adineta ricciae TaxID=249248 RepID=A0A813YCU4_ADIRI|nr:unnamed protein product [Adineta ricciae]